ncbi:MAG TPA: RelA/SpoT family protein, partial [Chitinophagales bacterium]|nr:RelA/SpoT family protein [Chitinophagales bacterium]
KPQMLKADRKLIRRAFEMAMDAHKDTRRKSGEPYIFHPLAVAQIVASEIGLGPLAVVCALLHDVVEDTELTLDDIEKEFGKNAAEIINGLTKISVLLDGQGYLQAENIRKVLLTLAKDVRVILIKLADRLHNMRTLESMQRNKQIKIASETVYLYVPLAHRLGLYNIKSELEDLAMKYTEPKVYKQIASKLAESKKERNRYINEFIRPLKENLNQAQIQYDIFGRSKSISSIWRKIREKSISFEEVYDKFAIRIIVDETEEQEKAACWQVYSIVTDTYRPNPDRLRDWISTPKANGYEALHTTVMGPQGKWVEVQIRSVRMNEIAEKGYAAHWKYKEKNDDPDSEFIIDDWLRRVRELLENPETNTLDFIDDFKLNLFSDEIYVFTPKGELRILPAGASIVDIAFEIHTDLGYHCIGAKVNHKIEPISYKLKSGDQVEVLTSRKQKPTEDWLKHIVTAKARSKVKEVLRNERRRIVDIGRRTLETIFRENKIGINSPNLNKVVSYYNLSTAEELYYSIGIGNFRWSDLDSFVKNGEDIDVKAGANAHNENIELAIKNKLIHNSNLFVFEDGQNTVDYNLAECCKPIAGDEVFGFINKNSDVEIHRANCPQAMNAISKYGYKMVRTKWNKQHQIAFLTGLKISGIDDVGVMFKITTIISGELKINMQSITIETDDGLFEGLIKIYVRDTQQLQELVERLQSLDGILSVTRLDEAPAAAELAPVAANHKN